HKAGQQRNVVVWPQLAIGRGSRDLKYRFQWNAPIVISPHEPSTLYHAAQILLRSRDEGQSWQEISPDLTRNDKSKQGKSGGPITHDDTGVEVYDTIFTVEESPLEKDVIWVGTDDGLVQLTRDGGKNWANVTPKGIPEWIRINSLDISPRDKGTCYVAATMYQFDDFRPYLYKTKDYGKTWMKIVNGIPENAFARVIREDPDKDGLLYAGTEIGLFVSFDDGANWQPFQFNLPVVPITDLTVKEGDLVVATQGRAFWILDDLSPVRQFKDSLAAEKIHVFKPRPAVRLPGGGFGGGEEEGSGGALGKNPPNGVLLNYSLKEKPGEKDFVTVEFLEGDRVLRSFTSEKKTREGEEAGAAGPPAGGGAGGPGDEEGERPIEPKAGLNRLVWDMRILRPSLLPRAVIWGNSQGPKVAPGTYSVRVKYAGQTLTETFEVRPNPNAGATAEDLKKQYDLLRQAREGLSACHDGAQQIRDIKNQVREIGDRAEKLGKGKTLREKGKALSDRLTAVEKKLVNPDIRANQDVLNFEPALDHQFAGLATVAASADAKPTDSLPVYLKQIQAELASVQAELKAVLDKDLAEFNQEVRKEEIPPVVVVTKKKEGG
ncbi:MAG TPA: glycosyl hydrolase, partial [Thermoanaerobaculia bacterium]|nr:glycosyl hydrolase [Thermoanaerobaculia bacterium]